MHTRVLSILFSVTLAALLSPVASAQISAPGHIKSVRVTGEVFATTKATGLRTSLAENAEIAQGAVVSTGKDSSVVLVFSNGAVVSLASDTELDVEHFTQDPFDTSFSPSTAKEEPTTSSTHLNLIHGELVSKVVKLNSAKGSDFLVKTPVGAAGIRGTIFRIIYRVDTSTGKASFSLVTLEGRVAVTLASGTVNARPVEVSAHKEIRVSVDVNVDANGVVTVSLPSGATTTVATNTSTSTNQQVAAAADSIAQAVANVVIPVQAPAQPTSPALPAPAPAPVQPTTTIQPINPTVVSPSR